MPIGMWPTARRFRCPTSDEEKRASFPSVFSGPLKKFPAFHTASFENAPARSELTVSPAVFGMCTKTTSGSPASRTRAGPLRRARRSWRDRLAGAAPSAPDASSRRRRFRCGAAFAVAATAPSASWAVASASSRGPRCRLPIGSSVTRLFPPHSPPPRTPAVPPPNHGTAVKSLDHEATGSKASEVLESLLFTPQEEQQSSASDDQEIAARDCERGWRERALVEDGVLDEFDRGGHRIQRRKEAPTGRNPADRIDDGSQEIPESEEVRDREADVARLRRDRGRPQADGQSQQCNHDEAGKRQKRGEAEVEVEVAPREDVVDEPADGEDEVDAQHLEALRRHGGDDEQPRDVHPPQDLLREL